VAAALVAAACLSACLSRADLQRHALAGFAISGFCVVLGEGSVEAGLWGLGAGTAAGLAKEGYDALGGGRPDVADALWTTLGALVPAALAWLWPRQGEAPEGLFVGADRGSRVGK